MWIKRSVETRLRHSAKTRPVVVLTGARQTGKTSTTLLRLFPNYSSVSLDLPTEAEQAEKEPRGFLQRHPPPVIIDEVQYAPGLFRHIKVEVDARRARNGQFLLTGSQKFALMKSVSESLAAAPISWSWRHFLSRRLGLRCRKYPWRSALFAAAFRSFTPTRTLTLLRFTTLPCDLSRTRRAFFGQRGSLRDFERFIRACALRTYLFEAKWTELPTAGDTVNLEFVRNVVGKLRGGAVIARTRNSFPFSNGFRAIPISDLD